ncbi:MAG: TRAP transporter substrate-binding protein [Rhodospirillales bacterium]|nr:TRAP transporter substrate-binding protein [Rhodospirillales bacterium]
MLRRRFLTGATRGIAGGLVATTAASAFPAPALAQGVRRLNMVTTWPRDFPGLGTGAQRLADSITLMTGGKLSVKVFAAGERVPAYEAFDAVSAGAADLYHGIEYYWQNRSRAFNFFATVPFGLTAGEMAAWIYQGGGQALWDELSRGFNIKPFQVGNTGVQMGGWYNKEINALEDFKGLKIRMPGLGGEVVKRLGAVPISLPGSQIFPALTSGKIDATEWAGPWNDLTLGFYKVAKHYYFPGIHEPGTALSSGINLKVWESLSADQKAIVTQAMAAENILSRSEFRARNADALNTLRGKHQVDFRRFSDDVLKAMGTAAGAVVGDIGAGGDPLTGKIYENFKSFRKKALSWTHIGEQTFQNARILPFKY